MSDESTEPEKDKFSDYVRLQHFYKQVQSMPQFVEKAMVIDQALLIHFEELEFNAKQLLEEFDLEKTVLLKHFEGWLLPDAKEILADLSKDTEELKCKLNATLQGLQALAKMDWEEHARSWEVLYWKWKDKKSITEKVLKAVSNRAQQLIDRDIKIIDDYCNQSLCNLSPEQAEFKNVEDRLQAAIEEPLKYLVDLKQAPSEPSVSKTEDWIAAVHQNREKYFDHVLMKIDFIVKDIVHQEGLQDPDLHVELEGEILFMEREIQQIQEALIHLNREDEKELEFIKLSLDSLKEHLENLNFANVSQQLKKRSKELLDLIDASLKLC